MDFPRWTKPTSARVAVSLLLLVGLIYAESLGGGFIQDDEAIYLDDPGLAKLTVREAFTGRPPMFLWHRAGYAYYRPVAALAYSRLLRLLPLQPFALHLISMAAYWISGMLVFLLALEFMEFRLAWLAAALFVVHPLHVESVAWMSGFAEIVAGDLMLLSLYTLLRARHGPKWLLAVSYVAGLLAMLTKETAFALPLLAAILVGWMAWPYLAMVAGAIAMRVSVLGAASVPLPPRTPVDYLSIPAATLLQHGKKLLFPWSLALEYDLSHSLIVWLLGGILLGAAVWLAWRNVQARIALLFTIVALAPSIAGAIRLPPLDRAHDRYAFLAVFGVVLLIGLACRTRWGLRGAAALLVLWSALSVVAITNWRNAETIWGQTLRVTPTSKNAILGLGDWYYSTTQFEQAARIYEIGLATRPNDPDYLYSLNSTRNAIRARAHQGR